MITVIGSELNPAHDALEIYVSGCKRGCPGCHNPEAQAFGKGKSARLWIKENRYKFSTGTFTRVWLLGGDLMDQPPHEAREFVRDIRKALRPGMELWLWTGHGLDDVPLRLRSEFDWIKAGDYREGLPAVAVAYEGPDGEPRRLTLASENQQLHRISAPCPEHPTPCARPKTALRSPASPDSAGNWWKGWTASSPNAAPA